ncbi:hypothetical protein HD806DRAFT_528296 [Xylariaceae sp. AK1471]|nr:hypothetical protein HD806DRAFT_528296 [Xylariaceae sp. AK1471]
MDVTKTGSGRSRNRQFSQGGRSSHTKDKVKVEDKDEEVDELEVQGWTREKDITANKVFLSGQVIIEGRLHATGKLCLKGRFFVTDKLEEKPAVVKNMIVVKTGVIHGDIVVNAGAYIKGICIVNGKLTITGELRLNGTLRCKSLNLTGTIRRYGSNSKIDVEGEKMINGNKTEDAELARLLSEHGMDE